MIGLIEIIFILIISCVIWYIIFKLKLQFDSRDKLRNIEKKIEDQGEKLLEFQKELKEKVKEDKEKSPFRTSNTKIKKERKKSKVKKNKS